jgi:prepilin-type N-terminal cleavage/methylation domain-containing protein
MKDQAEQTLAVLARSPAWICGASRRIRRRRGFTLVEVLATLLLISIVMPAVMQGVSIALAMASNARQRTEAATVAQSQLDTLLATNQWNGGILAGDVQSNGSTYHWQANVEAWPGDTTTVSLMQVDMVVTWAGRSGKQSITLSTITYDRTNSTNL